MKKRQEVELLIQDAAYTGKGVGKIDGFPVFVSQTAAGDRIRARITRKKKTFAEAKLLKVLEESPVRISPKCQHFADCGGCQWQHVGYSEQLRFKEQHVREHFERIGNLHELEIEHTMPCERPFAYRNKMEFSFGDQRWLSDDEIASGESFDRDFALGMHAPGRFDRIIDLDYCHLVDAESNRPLSFFREYAREYDMKAYNPHKHTGFFRNLIIRRSETSGQRMLALVVNAELDKIPDHLRLAVVEAFSNTYSSIVVLSNTTRSPAHYNCPIDVWYGKDFIVDSIGDYQFEIHPTAFFQTNSLQATRLFEVARDFADLKSEDLVLDLYCGVGTLSLFVSGYCNEVYGVELHEGAVVNARKNAKDNEVSNCRFVSGDVRSVFSNAIEQLGEKPSVVFTDPPRSGMHSDVVQQLLDLAPERIVYVSCNSATQARDLALMNHQYEIERIQPVDMFPQTYHIETVAKLTRRT